MRTAEWHDRYTLPSLWEFFQPSPVAHGSYFRDWGTEVETAWKRFFQVWFQLMRDYHDMGGRITTGTDSGFIYQTYGFAYPRSWSCCARRGWTRSRSSRGHDNGAKTLYQPLGIDDPPIGTVEPGKLVDLVIAPENPLTDITKPEWARRGGGFKTLYGTGHERLNEQTGELERVGGVRWTIKDGVVYDARRLLRDVAKMVQGQRRDHVAHPARGKRARTAMVP